MIISSLIFQLLMYNSFAPFGTQIVSTEGNIDSKSSSNGLLPEKFTLFKLLHSSKLYCSIDITDSGIVIDSRLEHWLKLYIAKVVSEDGNITSFKLVHPLKQPSIDMTEFGIIIDLRFLHP